MAYSISQQPSLYAPAYNDQIYVVTSSNNGQTNFNYIAQVYIGSDIITLKAPANPTYGSGVFNIGRIIENYVNSDIDRTALSFQTNANSYKEYYVRFGEEFGSTIVQYLNRTQTVVKYVWNGVLDFLEAQTYNQDSYTMEGSGAWLTRFTGARNQLTGDYSWLYWLADGSNSLLLSHIDIKSYTSADALIKSCGVTNTLSSSGVVGNHFARFSTGKEQLNAIPAALRYGTQPIIASNAAYYKVEFQTSTSGVISSTIQYNIVDADCKYSNYRLHFLNDSGGFESFNFTKLSRKETDINRLQYKAPVGALTSASAFGYAVKDRGDRQYFISSKDTIKIKSDWLTDLEMVMLRQLVESPEIYLDDSTYGLISVTCSATKFDTKTILNNKVFNLELDIQYGFDRYRQRY
jgi:hypothetical protein